MILLIHAPMDALKNYINSISPIEDETWEALRQIFKETTLKKGEYFVKEGESSSRFAFLESGIIRGFYQSDEGIEYNRSFFVTPSFIGNYSSLITCKPSLSSQQTLSDCRLLISDYSTLESLYDTYRDLERFARKFAENYFVKYEQKEIEIIFQNADKRYLTFQREYPDLLQQIPQYHIASYLGVSPTQLSRIRRKSLGA